VAAVAAGVVYDQGRRETGDEELGGVPRPALPFSRLSLFHALGFPHFIHCLTRQAALREDQPPKNRQNHNF
jgi:hypothetical protein